MTQPLRRLLTLLLIVIAALPGRALAQDQHIMSPSALAAAITQRVAQEQADRAAIRDALGQPEVRALASRTGMDPERLAAVTGTLSGSDLSAVASQARMVNASLAGGASTVTISTTTLIIALLVLILLIVALK